MTSRPGNLPVELTSFVGRRQGLADLKRALASTRLLTLTGVGGVGKTKLALRAGRENARQYPDGVWFVELAPVQDPEQVVQAVFTALGLQDHASSSTVSTLSGYLADKRPLLILDNCEHVHTSAAVLAGALLRGCPDVRILATSRQALGVTGEVVIDVPTLSLPEDGDPSPDALLRSDAVALFVERAAAVQHGFAVDATNAARILSVCRHVDGIPLAVELAAVRLQSLGLDALERGLGARLGSLGTGDRSLSLRQQTLEGAIDWSYQLLSDSERSLWARLSVFSGGFELDAVQSVCGGDGLDPVDIPELVGSLVEKSVVKREGDTGERFRLLQPLRQFGRERLRDAGAEQARLAHHRDWIGDLAAAAGANDARQVELWHRIGAERANLWSALEYCLRDSVEAAAGAEICRNLWLYWTSQGPERDVRRMLAALIEVSPAPARPRGVLLWTSAVFASLQGDRSAAIDKLTEALEIGRATRDPDIVVWALQAFGVVAYLDGRWDDTVSYATQSLHLADAMGFAFAALSARVQLVSGRIFQGDLDAGIELANAGLRLSESLGETFERATLLQLLAVASLHRGEPAEADAHARHCLELRDGLGDLTGSASAVEALASSAMALGAGERAATLLGAADALWQSIPMPLHGPLRSDHDRAIADAQAALGVARFETAHRVGLEMRRDDVIEYALAAETRGARRRTVEPAPTDVPLSRREMEVAGLVADGATNAQVASRLFISERTVESHIASIFNKLGLDTRLQVARWFASTRAAEPT